MFSDEAIPHAHDEAGTALGRDRIVALTDLDAEVLIDFVERQPTLRELAQKRGLASPGTPGDKGGILDFLAWWHSPPIAAALEALLQFHALRRELRHAQLREELIAILAQVAKTSTNAVEQRRAATTAIRATDRRSAVADHAAYRPYRSSRRAVGASGWGGSRATDHAADARSQPRGSDLRGRRGPASHVAPSSPLGGGGRAPRPVGAPSSTASSLPLQPRVHSAHTAQPDLNGGSKVEDSPGRGGAAPIDTNAASATPPVSLSRSIADSLSPAFATPLVSLSRSISGSAPIGVICGSPLPSAPSPDPDDAADDADLDDDDPEGTLAIAYHVLEAVESDPDAYPPEAIRAAHVYIQLAARPDKLADPHHTATLSTHPTPAAPDTS